MAPTLPRLLCVTLLSGAALGLEISLMRLFSIMLWQHFAAMVISLTLLGYGASGTFLAFAGPRLSRRPWDWFGLFAIAFGVLTPLSYAAAAAMQFNPLEVLWQPGQFARLAMVYVALGVPFFMVGSALGLALYSHPDHTGRIYAADLLGAGLGPAGAILLMLALPAQTTLLACCAAALLAGAGAIMTGGYRGYVPVALAAGVALSVLTPGPAMQPAMSEYKDLSRTLLLPGARILDQSSGPLGLLHTAVSPQIPLRYARGLSLSAGAGPPRQIGVYVDGNMVDVINAPSPWRHPDAEAYAYLDHLLTALPYRLIRSPRVFLAGSAGPGGPHTLQAFRLGAQSVTIAAPNPALTELTTQRLRAQGPAAEEYLTERTIHVRSGTARAALESGGGESFDLILADLTSGPAAATSGPGGHLATVQGVRSMVQHLAPSGLLALATPMLTPPREPLKLLATAARALELSGRDPDKHLAVARSWDSALVLVASSPFGPDAVRTIREFCTEKSFDTAWYPGMGPDQANRRNRLAEPYLYQGAVNILSGDREEFFRRYRFDVRPATDDRPFFSHFLKLDTLFELLGKRGSGGLSLVEREYPVRIATVAQAGAIGLVLILAPLAIAGAVRRGGGLAPRFAVYFLFLGLAFLGVEMAFLNMFSLSLGDPLLGAGLAIGAFLVFAGLGSRASARFATHPSRARTGVILAVVGVAAFTAIGHTVITLGADWLLTLSLPVRALILTLCIAPAAFCMGGPLPLGLYLAGKTGRYAVAWSWGLNGWASVLSAPLAQLVAVHTGFAWVAAGAVALYALAALMLRPA